MKFLLLIALLCFCIAALAESKTSNVTVSATIVYNCQIPDEKAKKFCDVQPLSYRFYEKNGYLIKEY